jgi:hypothetical protein
LFNEAPNLVLGDAPEASSGTPKQGEMQRPEKCKSHCINLGQFA